MRLIFLGAPGVGKGTLAKEVAKKLGIEHISTGAMLRDKVKDGDSLSQKLKSYMDEGKLVPEDMINSILEEKLQSMQGSTGYILDGYPRTLVQARVLDEILHKIHEEIDHVILVEIPEEVIVARLSNRLTCEDCGEIFNLSDNPPKEAGICDTCHGKLGVRADDRAETVRKRLQVYEAETKPLIDFYEKRGKVIRVDNSAAIQAGVESILKQIN